MSKRIPIGHVRKHWIPCKECDGLCQLPEKVQTTKGTETRWSPCWRCKGTGLMLSSVEELSTVFDDSKPEVGEKGKEASGKPLP